MREFGQIANGELLRSTLADSAPTGDWRLFKVSTPPQYDPETEECVEVAPRIESDGITRQWQVLTLAERRPGAGEMFTAPVPNDGTYIPKEVSLRQFLMAADRSGLLATLEALKTSEGIPQQTRRDIHFFLEYSNFIERNHPLIAQLAPVVGVTESQIDELFRAAAAL